MSENAAPGIAGGASKLAFDAQQLVILGQPVRARERACLDLPAVGRDCEIGDGRILGFARAVGHDGGIGCAMRHFSGIFGALLHKLGSERGSPFPGRIYPTATVTGMPSAV